MPRKFIILTSILCQLLYALDGIPDWYLNPPKEEGRIFGLGDDNIKMRALLHSLGDLERQYRSFYEGGIVTSNGLEKNKTTYGGKLLKEPFHLSGEIESMFDQNTGNDYFKFYEKLTFKDGGEASITSLFKEEIMGNNNIEPDLYDHYEATYSGTDETELLKHLKEQGFDFEIVVVEDRYFVKTGVDIPKPKILTE
tara:strand:+ start:155 stop:742 length:588 start_codon:yes stop_codon:yes gene_type:complete